MPQRAIRKHITELIEKLHESPDSELFQRVVDAPFKDRLQAVNLDLGIIALAVKNSKNKTIDRVAISSTRSATEVVSMSYKPFHTVKIPMSASSNLLVKAIKTKERQMTSDWHQLLIPVLDKSDASLDQATSAVGCSIVVPFKANKIQGVLIYDFHQMPEAITDLHILFVETYTRAVEKLLSERSNLST